MLRDVCGHDCLVLLAAVVAVNELGLVHARASGGGVGRWRV